MRIVLFVLVIIALAVLSACGAAAPADTPSPAGAPTAPPPEEVKALVGKGACGGCHIMPGVEGAAGTIGPSLCDAAEEFQAGEIDLAAIREFIVNPNAEITEGYSAGIMPDNFGQLYTEQELDTLVAAIATLQCE